MKRRVVAALLVMTMVFGPEMSLASPMGSISVFAEETSSESDGEAPVVVEEPAPQEESAPAPQEESEPAPKEEAAPAPKEEPAPAPAAPAAAVAAAPTVDAAKSLVLQLNALPIKAATEAAKTNAKVTIVEFSDYECPFCSRAEPTIAEIMKQYPNDVRVAFINNPLPMHKNAEGAAKAALAAQRQGKFWEMHEALFANQRGLNDAFYAQKAAELGLDAAKFQADMNDPAIKDLIDKGMKDGAGYGISGTPSFLINGVLLKVPWFG